MVRKSITCALALALIACPLAACSSTNKGQETTITTEDGRTVQIVPVQFEIYLQGFIKDSTPLTIVPMDAEGNEYDSIPITADQITDNRATAYMRSDITSAKLIAPVNPDGSTYAFDNDAQIEIVIDGTNAVKGELINTDVAAADAQEKAEDALDADKKVVEKEAKKVSETADKVSDIVESKDSATNKSDSRQ